MDDYKQRLFALGEATLGGSPFSMRTLRLRFSRPDSLRISCESFGVEQGRLENIAHAIGDVETIKNRLKSLRKKVASGDLVDFGVLQKKH